MFSRNFSFLCLFTEENRKTAYCLTFQHQCMHNIDMNLGIFKRHVRTKENLL